MAVFDVSFGDTVDLAEQATYQITDHKPMYGDPSDASRYFSELLYGQLWEIASADNQSKALIQSTRIVDGLRFHGSKTDEAQVLQFPRNGDDFVPADVLHATYEVALALLKGVDPETELGNIFVETRAFGKVRTDYNYGRSGPEHIVAGIPSLRAWQLLKPYVNPALELKLTRKS
jgi:hypothetical protein